MESCFGLVKRHQHCIANDISLQVEDWDTRGETGQDRAKKHFVF